MQPQARFKPATFRRLREGEWYEGRHIDPEILDCWETLCRHARRPVHPAAMKFWAEFVGVGIQHSINEDFFIQLNPNVSRYLDDGPPAGVLAIEQVTGLLFPIGEDELNHLELFIAPDGKILAYAYDCVPGQERMILIGNTGDEAIENLLAGVPCLIDVTVQNGSLLFTESPR